MSVLLGKMIIETLSPKVLRMIILFALHNSVDSGILMI